MKETGSYTCLVMKVSNVVSQLYISRTGRIVDVVQRNVCWNFLSYCPVVVVANIETSTQI